MLSLGVVVVDLHSTSRVLVLRFGRAFSLEELQFKSDSVMDRNLGMFEPEVCHANAQFGDQSSHTPDWDDVFLLAVSRVLHFLIISCNSVRFETKNLIVI